MKSPSRMAFSAARIALAVTLMGTASAPAKAQVASMAQISVQIVRWGQANASAFATAMAASQHPSGKVPVPPLIDPPCNLCGQQNMAPNGAQQAMAKAQAKLNAAGVVVPKEANMMSLAASVMSVQLPWANGQIESVNRTLRAEKNGDKIELRITVRQAPQQ